MFTMTTLVLIMTVVGGLAGVLSGRLISVPIAAAALPVYVLGRKEGLWGAGGVGEGWYDAMIVGAVVAAVGATVGVLLRRAGRGAMTPRPFAQSN